MIIRLFQCPICDGTFSEKDYGEAAEARARDCEARGSTPYRFEVRGMVVIPYYGDIRGTILSRGRFQDHSNYYRVRWREEPRVGAVEGVLLGRQSRVEIFPERTLLKFNPQETTNATAETEAVSAAQG